MAVFREFIGGAYKGANPVSANETLVNWYRSRVETPGATFEWELLPTPGVTTFATAAVSGGRGAWAGDGRCFVAFGDTLYESDSAGTLTSRGTLALDANPVTFSTNGDAGNQLLITSGGNVYSYDLTTDTLTTEITGGVLMGGVVDGYGCVFITTTGSVGFRISDLFDLTTWDPLQFALRSIQPDLWQSMLIDPYGYITLMGSKTGESWANASLFPFPFAPDRSGLIEEGIAAPFSFKQAGKSKVWLSTNANGGYQVFAMRGFTPQRISHHALEHQIAQLTAAQIAEAFADTYEQEGHAFYLLSFPSGGQTWCYDFTTGEWHRRGTMIAGQYTYWRPAFHCFAFGKHLAVDRDGPTVFEVSETAFTDVDGLPLVRERTTPATTDEDQELFFDYLKILCQPGVGLMSGAPEDVDPKLMLQVSNDYGETFGVERQASLGKVGKRDTRASWWLLGSGRGRVYRVRSSAAVPVRITAAFQKVRGGAALEAAS